MSFEVIRTKRKTVALIINSEGELIVRAPLQTPNSYIEDLVIKKADWIRQTQERIRERNLLYPPLLCREGEWFPYLGQDYQLEFNDYTGQIRLNDDRLLVPHGIDDVKATMILWYKSKAKEVIVKRLDLYSKRLGLEYKAMRITNASRRWGSCSTKGTVNFSWRLVMCPLQVIDYVVIHELCHLKHHNHSQEFWQTVGEYMPDYQIHRKWLADNQRIMDILQ
ncbi:M48 family metallopeptidase [Dethiobacter alkaliphilus]|uniref:YgjP-like metallopeptidase domain-containing protein n=1 Tax=Dethiobacter alkaliphilus AHT 1 TaxID=555088 RepID=C0GCJ4_DETAL|nr:SprT family zinc-dependent metalloprotease [Dethiobacter alkaliphilus]EEG78929.1 protein of unknown function DUF45 [Dethiobacter alkaliphilus AHT 1]